MMIHILHLLWIVPVSGFIGFMTAAIICSATQATTKKGGDNQ